MIHDIGHKPEMMESKPMGKNNKHYPSINISEKELPCLKGVKVGEKISLLVLCEVTGSHKRNNDPTNYTLEIKKMGEEGEMKMSAAMKKAMGEHKELGDKGEEKEED